jgi:putative zinc finger protein
VTVIGGRGGRQDDWSSPHARARARAAERLDGPLDIDESAWLDEHLDACEECSAAARDYAAQRLELRALRDRAPQPPRDLWARTSAALERESRHHARRRRPASLTPYALLAGALAVAVVVGTLSSSQRPGPGPAATPGTTPQVAVVSPTPELVGPTPLALDPQDVAFLRVGQDGNYELTQGRFNEACPADAPDCDVNRLQESVADIGPLATPEAVFGSGDKPLVIVGQGDGDANVVAVLMPTDVSAPTPTPESTAPDQPTPPATEDVSSPPPTVATPTTTAGVTVPPSDAPTATPSEPATDAVEIAHGLEVLGTTAAYAPDGSAFAFTAQPADGSTGPDIYVWTVGDDEAKAVTTDHRSVFGSWSGSDVIGSSLQFSADGTSAAPTAIVVPGASAEPAAMPGAGLAWRPAVDPRGENAVYWAGTLTRDADGAPLRTDEGRLVLGRWGDVRVADPSTSPPAPDASDQADARNETTIAEGPVTDWDARWDETGTRLAVWVANPGDPSVGALSLYVVDPFDGSIDLENPPLSDEPALAGFSMDDGRLAWAAPPDAGDDEGRVLVLAWNEDEFGTVESAPGDFVLVR